MMRLSIKAMIIIEISNNIYVGSYTNQPLATDMEGYIGKHAFTLKDDVITGNHSFMSFSFFLSGQKFQKSSLFLICGELRGGWRVGLQNCGKFLLGHVGDGRIKGDSAALSGNREAREMGRVS